MAENSSQANLRQKRERRKRINRIKTGMLLIIAIWIILSIVTCIILGVRVHSLQNQVNDLKMNQEALTQALSNVNEQEDILNDTSTADAPMQSEDLDNGDTTQGNKDEVVSEMKVYLTFDDGPSDYTNEILDILNQYNVKATFFVIGKEDEASKAVYKRIVEEGHTLGMHSYSHKYSEIYASLDAFKADFEKSRAFLTEVTGVEPTCFRFPGGSSNKVSNVAMTDLIKYLNEQGVTYWDWNVASGDATSQAYSTEDIIHNVMGEVTKHNTSVVLLHDANNKHTTVESLASLIEELQASGADILPVTGDTTLVQHIAADSVK